MVKFSKEFNGYDKDEVNSYLNEITIETEKLLNKLDSQQQEITNLKQQILHYQDIERSLNIALMNVSNVGENIRKMANDEYDTIIADAKRNASKIVNDALIRNEKIELKTQQAERNLRIFKNKLRTIIEDQLEIVDEIETLEL